MKHICSSCMESVATHESGFCVDCYEAMSAPIPESFELDDTIASLAADTPFEVTLTSTIHANPGNLLFTKGERFNVYPPILRFDQTVYEVADGYAKGFMLNVEDCCKTNA